MSTRVLLVEDDAWYADQQQRLLGEAGYEVVWARDAQEAIEYIDTGRYKALVVDVLLTHNTVMTLLHELQSSDDTARVPVVVYTAQAGMLTLAALAPYGVIALLDKTTMHPRDTLYALRRAGV